MFLFFLINYEDKRELTFILNLKIFDIKEFIGEERWLYFLVILVVYGLAHIPQAYLLGYLFKVSATGFAVVTGWLIVSS